MKRSSLLRERRDCDSEPEKPRDSRHQQNQERRGTGLREEPQEIECCCDSHPVTVEKFYRENQSDLQTISTSSNYKVIRTVHHPYENFYNLCVIEENYKKNDQWNGNFSDLVEGKFAKWVARGSHVCELQRKLQHAKQLLNQQEQEVEEMAPQDCSCNGTSIRLEVFWKENKDKIGVLMDQNYFLLNHRTHTEIEKFSNLIGILFYF